MKKFFFVCCGLMIFASLSFYGLKKYIRIGDPSCSGISNIHYPIVISIVKEVLDNEFKKQSLGLDDESKYQLQTIFGQIYSPGYCYQENFGKHAKNWENNERPLHSKYIKRDEDVMDSLYFEHGLRFSSQKIKDYVADKDILNIGAKTHNPARVLAKYTDGKIFCIGEKLTDKTPSNLQDKCIFINTELFSQEKVIDLGNANINGMYNKKLQFKLNSLDSLFANKTNKIGFIRIRNYVFSNHEDGDELINILKGGLELIKKNRPVLSISYCSSKESLFNLKPFLENNLPDYVFEIQRHGYKNESTAVLFCYPKELANMEKA